MSVACISLIGSNVVGIRNVVCFCYSVRAEWSRNIIMTLMVSDYTDRFTMGADWKVD